MKTINKDLIGAARDGDEAGLKALLLRPRCGPAAKDGNGMTALMHAAMYGKASCVQLLVPVSDALARDNFGFTALMHAAIYGNASCVQLLMPVSNVLAKSKRGMIASELARSIGNSSLAASIDAYALALSEMSTLGSLVEVGAPCTKAPLRM